MTSVLKQTPPECRLTSVFARVIGGWRVLWVKEDNTRQREVHIEVHGSYRACSSLLSFNPRGASNNSEHLADKLPQQGAESFSRPCHSRL